VDVVDGKVVLRIVQVGTPFADVDQISLMVEGEELTPEYARYTGSGQSIVEDILELDHNVVIAHEQEIEASWDVPAGYGSATVYLTANEYGHGLPFRFPETGYATYEVGSNIGPITVDGLITETDGTVPLYSPYWQPSSGHPDGYTYIYVCDDEQYVYFSLDITMDNTNEYGEDWAEIRILQPDGSEQTFRIDDFDNTWGESGFGLTSKVSYKHQTCEFAIPKNIIGNEDIEFSLAYYGTGSVGADAYANAMVDPLVITINGTSSSGQVFNVGDTIYVEGYVHSIANASVDYGVYLLETTLGCDLWLNPGGLEHAWDGEADSTISSGNYTELFSEYDGSIWFTHTLTTPGDYTITLDSDASASVSYTNGESIEGTSSYAPQKSLSFYVSSTPQAPEADFHASGTIVCANVTIDFFDDSTGTYDSWYWDFGDGSNSTLESPSHAYTNVGNYTVSLTVSGGYGEDTETKADYITVLLVDGKLFMVDGGNSTIYELDPSTGAVLNTIPTPIATDGGGDGLAYGDGRMFFTTIDTNIIYEIDPSTGEIINRLGPESKVAVYAADTAPYTADVQAKLTSTGLFSQVDAFLVESGDPVPTLAELQEYDAVLVYSDGEFGNSTAMGDVLADYVDAGGGAVIATFAFWDPAGWDGGIGGRISSGGYLPFTQGEQSAGTNLTLVADEPEHPILSGVTSFNGGLTSWFNTVNLTSEADLVAHWSNDVPLIAVQYPMAEGAGRVVGLNFFPVSSDAQSPFWDSSTDGDLLMANSLLFAAFNYEYEIDALGFSGDALYALQYGDNATIRVLDPDTGANITTLEPGIPLVGGLTFAGTRNSLFVSNNGESAPSFGMTNKGFESGNFVGWNVYTGTSGTAWVVTLWNSPNGTNYTAANGDRFALLQNGDQNESTYISQNFTVDAGDIIGGWAFFSTREDPINDPGFNDQCSVDIMDGATLVDRVFYADTYDANWPDGPWTYWSWEAPSAGNYTLLARVVNIGDSEVSSYMGLDIPLEGPSTIYEISAESGAVLNSFPDPVGSGYGLYGLGFSSARDTLFLGFYESNMIYEVDPDTGYVINSFAGPEGAAISALAADECGGAPTTPEADFHASNTTVCGNVTIDFFDDSTGTYDSWYWDFGDGTNSTLPNPSHSYTSAGNYTVSLTISDGYGDDTETKVNYVTVLLAPEASFHASITMACAGVTFNFTDDSTGACDGWYWDFGDGSNSTDQNPSHAYASAANYTVSLTVSNCCCQDTETKIDYITVLPQPQADFHANITTACAGVTINFTDDSTGVCDSWYWDFGDGSNSTIQSPSHAYTSAGNYTVLVHVSNAWCEDEETKTDYITVLPLPEADFHASDTSPSVNVEIDFLDDSSGTYDSWYWDFGDGTNSTVQSPSHTYTIVGNYTVSLTISNGCGSDTETKVNYIEVLPLPEADFHANNTTVCANVTIGFFDDSTGTYDSWYWDFGDGSSSTVQNPSHAYTNAGSYTVSLNISGGYGEDAETKADYITILPLPEADFHASNTTVCANVTIDFFDDSTGAATALFRTQLMPTPTLATTPSA